MTSKGKGKGKGFAKKMDLEPQKKLIAQYDGALDNSFFIEAEIEKNRWLKARILECRLAKGKKNYNWKKVSSFFHSFL